MDNTSSISNFYMVTLKEGNGRGKKVSIIYKNCQFLSTAIFSFSSLFWSIHSIKQKEGCN